MKKAISLTLILMLFISLAVSANAEVFNGADLFTVDIPEEFQQTDADENSFSFGNNDGDTFIVTYVDNTEEDGVFSVKDMSEKDIEEYTSTLSEEAETVMKDYADAFELKFLSGEKIKHKSGKTALACQTKTTITSGDKNNIYYQTMYEFGGANYKYTFTYTTADEDQKDSFNEVFASIDIFESETQSNLDKLSGYAGAGVIVLLLVIGIIRFIRTPEKRKQGKLK